MKKFFLGLVFFATLSVSAQKTAEEIVEKYIITCGGLSAFNKITSAKMTGSVGVQGYDLPVTMEILIGKGMRMDVDAMGQTVTNAYYNGKGWKVNPFAGVTSPTEATGDELAGFKAQASLANSLMDYKNRGHKIELAGEETVEGVKAFKIKLTTKDDGKVTHYYIADADFMLIKTSSIRNIQDQDVEVENWYSNYKEFGGAKIAMSIIQKVNGETAQEVSWSSIELNVKIDEKIFEQ